jgi:hypothetical protein
MPQPDRDARAALWEALSAFHQSPGRHAVAHGEPRLLFNRLREVMLLAAGRAAVPGTAAAPTAEVERAARFFVRTVMLRPNGSHYDVLGVGPSDDPGVIREHYRLLIRMTHPDFADGQAPWPDDAAARVNRAYDVLSSPTRRAEYDAQIRPPEDRVSGARPAAAPPPRRHDVSAASWRKRLGAYVAGGLAVGALAALAMLWPSAEDTTLGTLAIETPQAPLLKLTESPEDGPGDVMEAPQTLTNPGRKPAAVPPARAAPAPAFAEAAQEAAPAPVFATTVQAEVVAASPEAALPTASAAAPAARDKAPAAADISAYQPLLADLLHLLESGQADRLQRWTARATQQDDSAERFANAYRRLMGDSVVTGLGQVRFDLRTGAERPVVQGLVQLRMLDRNQQATVRDFRLRAQFVAGASGPQLAAIDVE